MAEMISASAAPISTKNMTVEDIRRSMTYHPSVWGDHFLAYTSHVTEISAAEKEQLETLKGKVNKLLAQTPDDSTVKLELIDAIQRLGVGYHFQKEIDESLRLIHEAYEIQCSKDNDDVGAVALRFRLLRQQGYRATCDVFNRFLDEEGNFKESLMNDVEGMLSLYEASNYGVNGEEIMEKALEFSSSHLEFLLPKISITTSNCLCRRVKEALAKPVHLTLVRVGAKKFISMYEEEESHNHELLQFAKLDFNIVQKMHQKELHLLTRWWKDLELINKLPFARDRLTESYFWTLGVYFEPQYERARRFLTPILAILTVLDDVFDVQGTLEELQHFTDAIRRWDISAGGELPAYMRSCYEALLGVYADMEDEMGKQGEAYRVQYAIQEMQNLLYSYMNEAEWCYGQYIPSTMEEYMKVGLVSGTHMCITVASLVGMEDPLTQYDFDWLTSRPPILKASEIIARLMDDMAGHGKEKKTTAVGCLMKEKGWSEMEAISEIWKTVKKTWKDINEEWLLVDHHHHHHHLQTATASASAKSPSSSILVRIINFTRVLHIIYSVGQDGFTDPTTTTKNFIQDIIVDPLQF